MPPLINRSLPSARCGCVPRAAAHSVPVGRVISRTTSVTVAGKQHLFSPLLVQSVAARDVSQRSSSTDASTSEAQTPLQAHMQQLWQDNTEVTVAVTGATSKGLKVLYREHEGFVHSWSLGEYTKGSGFLLVGTDLNVKVTGFDEKKGTWLFKGTGGQQMEGLEEGQVVSGTWASVREWGAFIALLGCQGLVHNTRFSHTPVTTMVEAKVIVKGAAVKAFVLEVDRDLGRVTLSTKLLEVTPGDMVTNPQAVYDAAEETGAALRRSFQEASRSASGPLKMSEFFA